MHNHHHHIPGSINFLCLSSFPLLSLSLCLCLTLELVKASLLICGSGLYVLFYESQEKRKDSQEQREKELSCWERRKEGSHMSVHIELWLINHPCFSLGWSSRNSIGHMQMHFLWCCHEDVIEYKGLMCTCTFLNYHQTWISEMSCTYILYDSNT